MHLATEKERIGYPERKTNGFGRRTAGTDLLKTSGVILDPAKIQSVHTFSVEAEWMRDQKNVRRSLLRADEAVCSSTKTILSFDLEQHHLVCGAKVAVAPFFLLPQPLLLN
jgi:hypothetical protein